MPAEHFPPAMFSLASLQRPPSANLPPGRSRATANNPHDLPTIPLGASSARHVRMPACARNSTSSRTGRRPSRLKEPAVDEGKNKRLVGAVPRLAYEDIVRHPHLAAARKVYVDSFVDMYDDNPFLVRLLIETGRFAVFLMTILIEASYDPARRATWLTIGRLQREMASF